MNWAQVNIFVMKLGEKRNTPKIEHHFYIRNKTLGVDKFEIRNKSFELRTKLLILEKKLLIQNRTFNSEKKTFYSEQNF